MSWLYSIIFAGLMFSSGTDRVSTVPADTPGVEPPAAESLRQDVTEKFEQTYPLSPGGRLSLSNVNGSITVEAWDRNEVHLEATKVADSAERFAEVEIKVNARPDSITIETEYDNVRSRNNGEWGRRKLEVHYKLSVPADARLDEIGTVNGSVRLSNFRNHTKASAVNGSVMGANLRGTAKLSTVNGEVSADFDRLESGSNISLETVNGKVNLMIPSDSNATVKADSLNGPITNEFGLPVRKGQYVGRDLYGRIGSGEVSIKLSSVNGPLSITRKKDGRNPNPATDLLPQLGAEELDDTGRTKVGSLNAETARAVREARRATAAEMRKAQAEMRKLEKLKIELPEIPGAPVVLDGKELSRQIREGLASQEAALAAMADVNFAGMSPRLEKKSNSFPVKGRAKVSIDAPGCAVKVTGWDRPEVRYVVTQYSRFGSAAEPVQVAEEHKGDSVDLKVTARDADAGRFFADLNRVRIEVFVPKKSDLKIKTDSEIRIEGVSGELDVTGEDNAINVRDADGKLKVVNADGRIRIVGFRGNVNAQTVDGDVYLEGEFDELTANGVDGSFYLTLPPTTNADLTSNAEVTAEGVNLTRAPDGKWRIGNGGAKYSFTTEGRLIVRNSSAMSVY